MNMQQSGNHLASPPFIANLALQDGPFERVLHVMNLLAVSGAGLGEVLPDYAQQTSQQMEELMQAAERFANGKADAETIAALKSAYFVLSSAVTVLEMTPAAMLRNKADMIGTREKLSREEVVRITRAFRQAPELQKLMESEESCGEVLAQVFAQ